ncbi:hypothetical protein LTR47_003457 [Exophiala xenobiotica]|nr:hypothetical protein LTR41_009102 [Exophiala xenobiotica]KAK5218969.1 hypothetical protein LTR72_008151 [Exophiala xenobiotica]KAK5235272.1 hypothetical protein LTR47_003457 [Exophiala xenobiotica]KAK5249566.1 hypothetical protein LTS06_005490 [Exophiala xenobiotica]KAK5291302.1 hypothetical protein LTR14_005876 [Exophiala xenobiotica]
MGMNFTGGPRTGSRAIAGFKHLPGFPFTNPLTASTYTSLTASLAAAEARSPNVKRSERGSEGPRSTSVVSDSTSERPHPLNTMSDSDNWWRVFSSTHSDTSSADPSLSSEQWDSASEAPTLSSTGAEHGSSSSTYPSPSLQPVNGDPEWHLLRPDLPLLIQPESHHNEDLRSNVPSLPQHNQAPQQDDDGLRLWRPILPTNEPFRDTPQPGPRNVAWGYFYRSRLGWLLSALEDDRAQIEPYSHSIADINDDIRMQLQIILVMAQKPEFLCDRVFLWKCGTVIRDVQHLKEGLYRTLEYIQQTRMMRDRQLLDEQYQSMIDQSRAQMLEMVRNSWASTARDVFDLGHFGSSDDEKEAILWLYRRQGMFCS